MSLTELETKTKDELVDVAKEMGVSASGLRARARIAALIAERRGEVTPELEEAMGDSVPLVFGGIATILVPAMVALSVFRPG